jgi:hypothetical protein
VFRIDRAAPLQFLRTAFQPEDWVAVVLKSYETGRVVQRVGPLSWVMHSRFQAWLRFKNAQRFNVYVSVNAMAPGRRSRRRESVGAIRHVFLDADQNGLVVLARIMSRSDLPTASYVVHTSPNRLHVFWRVVEFERQRAEALQKQLSRELGTDSAATPATQMTRLPGFLNHKYVPPHMVTTEYLSTNRTYSTNDFPLLQPVGDARSAPVSPTRRTSFDVLERAGRYLDRVPPAIAGEHGDVHTFRVCCRLVRGFALDDVEALGVLQQWNERCQPPWTEPELVDKLRRARRYGVEPVGGLLNMPP